MDRKIGFFLVKLMIILLIISPGLRAEDYLFQMRDAQGDDYGPGTYVYPTSEQFAPFEGLFDLLEFRVKEAGSNYLFKIEFAKITNPWQAKYGFSHQLVQIYIDNDSGGSTQVFKPGANVEFDPDAPWNKLVKINGWQVEVFDYQDDPQAEFEDNTATTARVLDDQRTIEVKVPQELIGDLKSAQYYVLVGALDGFSHDNFRPVVEEVEEWKFGGGTDTDYNPNVIDILVPEGKEQREILGAYNVENEELATLYPVGDTHFKISRIFALLLILAIVLGVKYRKELLEFKDKFLKN
ncbi:glucodextranase DOMON-like domain-containing protein [Fuchsiella alkaliacetigena]|uniref:glucodextranase DOMON-like domain-containing protein n=1 Tax=Fuchsiella alkaliacetigena TaxID=957042 RepID=UPI00200B125E|nr:glucodextranase DOMON-like domain-containing protein [Fuchsiella alkaliacetigena]MCK8824861.1 hypothetical protein [Fuchsiella alkaliacetigena]